ncbi:MAG: GNAT family N-acetyltransferase [Planctomycetota bacterium]|jgi:RimJ/RimL family protein N-acetyltransferase
MIVPRVVLVLLPAFVVGCTAPESEGGAAEAVSALVSSEEPDRAASPWLDLSYEPPTALVTDRMLLEPLAVRHVELDFAALMGSREHLQRTLHWGDWPRPDFTVEENREDLERHWKEFEAREGYAFTVLSPDRARCLGCVYLSPAGDPQTSRDALLAYWVIEEQLPRELDRHLLEQMLAWIERDWLFERVAVPVHVDDTRGADLARALGLERVEGAGGESALVFSWRR